VQRTQSAEAQSAEVRNPGVRAFLRGAAVFVGIGMLVYIALYAAAEWLVYHRADRNRFFMVRTAPPVEYGHVILGASHAAVFDFADMNRRLEEMTGTRILNLAVVGGGVAVNRLLLDYFLAAHRTGSVVYVVDSFAFYSPEWNERRLEDARLFQRAPFDPSLARLLVQDGAPWPVTLDYVSGFSKINNPDRFGDDRPAEAARFDRRYRAVEQIDRQRLAYLYPAGTDEQAQRHLQRYLADFETLVVGARRRGLRVVLVRPPLPPRTRALMPDESAFDAALTALAGRTGAELHDLSATIEDPAMYFDTDHLNRTGVAELFERHLAGILRKPS
jgi:hypothetical protein